MTAIKRVVTEPEFVPSGVIGRSRGAYQEFAEGVGHGAGWSMVESNRPHATASRTDCHRLAAPPGTRAAWPARTCGSDRARGPGCAVSSILARCAAGVHRPGARRND